MNIYNITKGQLITVWVIGTILCFHAFVISMDTQKSIIFCFLIPPVLIFYTLGWKNYRRSNSKE